jgi:hypothetical protein
MECRTYDVCRFHSYGYASMVSCTSRGDGSSRVERLTLGEYKLW